MASNLATSINKIMGEVTSSGVKRINRIKEQNPGLYRDLSKALPDEYGDILIQWSKSLYNTEKNAQIIYMAQNQFLSYCTVINELSKDIENIDNIVTCIKYFNNQDLIKLTNLISNGSSKILNRINNLKLLCAAYQSNKEKNKGTAEKILKEQIMTELSYQNCFFYYILSKNMEPFKKMYFPIGLVLYDIPANPEEDLFFIKQLKEAQIL